MGNRVLQMWRESREFGIVVLEFDWGGEPLGLPMLDPETEMSALSPLPPRERACLVGYAREDDHALFVVEPDRFPFLLRSGASAFLAAGFNGWEKARREEKWRLLPTEDGLLVLKKPWKEIAKLAPFSFKFVTERGKWLDPPEEAPNIDKSIPSARNFLFLADRSCRDILRFTIPPKEQREPIDDLAARFVPEGWFGVRVEESETRFRLFAPRATSVTLEIASRPDLSDAQVHSLAKDASGAWEATIQNDLSRQYYRYFVDGDNNLSPGAAFLGDFNPHGTVLAD